MCGECLVVRASIVIDIWQLFGASRIALEKLFIVGLHTTQMPDKIGRKSRTVCIAEESRKPFHRFNIGRQNLCLLVGDHLQTMFDAAQEFISRR